MADPTPEEIAAALAKLDQRAAGNDVAENIDMSTGAPAQVRALVGGAPPEGQLLTLRKFYPDARPYLQDGRAVDGQFVFTNPDTGKLTLYNSPGLDWGDAASVAREGVQAVTSGLGAAAGTALGAGAGTVALPGVGTVAGGVSGGLAGAGLGNAAGGAAYDFIANLFGMSDPRSLPKHLIDAGMDTVYGMAGQGAGEMLGAGVRAGTRALFRGGEKGRQAMEKTIADFSAAGAQPTVGQASPSMIPKALEGLLSVVPGGYNVFLAAAKKTNQDFAKKVAQISFSLARTAKIEPEMAGRKIQAGIDAYVENFRSRAKALYDAVDPLIPPKTIVDVGNTMRTLRTLSGTGAPQPVLGEAWANGTVKKMLDGLTDEQKFQIQHGVIAPFADRPEVSWAMLKAMRTRVGNMLDDGSLVADVNRGELKQIYAALSEDMRAAVAPIPDAARAFDRASNFWKAGSDHIETSLQPFANMPTGEEVFQSLFSSGAQGPTRIRALRASMPDDVWNLVQGTALKRMGEPTPGVADAFPEGFNAIRFLTQWNTLTPSARQALFSPTLGNKQLMDGLDTIVRATTAVKSSGRVYAQSPGTTPTLIGGGGIFGGVATMLATGDVRPITVLMATAATMGAGSKYLMTNPRFVNWLAKSTKIAPQGFSAHVGRLAAIGANERDPEVRDAIGEFLGILSGGGQPAGGQ